MLSLVGSIQPDPFSPDLAAEPPATTTAQSVSQRKAAQSRVEHAALSEREVDAMIEDDGGSDGDDEDPFEMLGKRGDEEERRAREAQEEEARKEKAAL